MGGEEDAAARGDGIPGERQCEVKVLYFNYVLFGISLARADAGGISHGGATLQQRL
jgi:hypothetical protein